MLLSAFGCHSTRPIARLSLREPLAISRQLLMQFEEPKALDRVANRIMARPIRRPTQQMLRQEVLPEPCVVLVLQTRAQRPDGHLRVESTLLRRGSSVM